MGEYFMICNLGKKELISPGAFGHGNKPGDSEDWKRVT